MFKLLTALVKQRSRSDKSGLAISDRTISGASACRRAILARESGAAMSNAAQRSEVAKNMGLGWRRTALEAARTA